MEHQSAKSSIAEDSHTKRTRFLIILLLILMVFLSGFYLRFSWNRYRETASAKALFDG